MSLEEEVRGKARELGFARVRIARPEMLPVRRTHPQTFSLTGDPWEILPSVQAILLLVWPYRPYCAQGRALLDAYYPASNAAHEAAMRMEAWLREKGYEADMRAPLPRKPLAARSGLGTYGRNSLIAVDEMGSWVSLQCVLTSAPLPFAPPGQAEGFSPECLRCHACEKACPTGALSGDGEVNLDRCLRAQPESEPVREEMRLAMGASLLGCNACQVCCPRNRAAKPVEPPEELLRALDLGALLRGEYKPLIPFLGKNNARKLRVQARACLMAAHDGRVDLLPEIRALETSDGEAVRIHAAWARQYLEELLQK